MAFNILFLAFILLAVSLKTKLQVEPFVVVEPFTISTVFPFARFGFTFSAAVAFNHCRSRVNFLHLTKTFIRSRPSKTLTLLIIILSVDIQVNPGPTSIYPCGLPVTWDHQRAACCCNCKSWYHSEYIELSSSKINILQFSNVSWICCHCVTFSHYYMLIPLHVTHIHLNYPTALVY